MEFIAGGIAAPQGFTAAGVEAGIRKLEEKDVAVVFSQVPAIAAATYTLNKFRAAPLIVSEEHLADNKAQAVAINSGIANACTGTAGLAVARATADYVAGLLGIRSEDVLVASTGLIGSPIPEERIFAGLREAVSRLSTDGGGDAAEAIMTTDLVKKEVAVEIMLGGKKITIGAMAKGSGMIHPNMATMLAFLTTDAAISAPALQTLLKDAVDRSFNMISVDGDTSTNDMALLMANGLAGNEEIVAGSEEYTVFRTALEETCVHLARQIAADGEGATKLLTVEVKNAADIADARLAARAVTSSNLVKSALFGHDANWGRIVTALGYSGAEFDPMRTNIYIGDLLVAKDGGGLEFDEARALEILSEPEVTIIADLQAGSASATAWGCDLSYEYIKINAEYRS